MEFRKIIKDKRVIYGGSAALALVILFVFMRAGKSSGQSASADDGNSDTGALYFPVDFASSIGAGNSAAQASDPTASLMDLAKTQTKSQTQLGLGAIGSDFMEQIIDKFKTQANVAGKFQGLEGTFGFDANNMLDFDFTFKQVMTTPAQPKQNVQPPSVTYPLKAKDNSGNHAGNRDK